MTSCLFGYVGLNLLMAFFFLLACVTSVVLTNRNYNTSSNTNNWILVGALTPSSANFRVRLLSSSSTTKEEEDEDRLVVSLQPVVASNAAAVYVWDEPLLSSTTTTTTDEDANNNNTTSQEQQQQLYVQSITVDSLQSDTLYYYGILSVDGQQVRSTGQFRTAPLAGQRTNFRFATAGCAMTGSRHTVFGEIAKEDILFFLHLGDFHYLDVDSDVLQDRIVGIDKVMGSSSQAALLASTALAYMWDDHDWLGNDSYGYSQGRETALASYRQAFPHPEPLPSSNSTAATAATASGDDCSGGVYHAFTIGTVRFVLSDLRSERTQDTIYSEEQREWLYNELAQADQYDFIVWVTPTPWIGPEDPDEDSWMGAAVDRRELSSFISEALADTQNLLAISADAHMVGFDDGSHTFYGEIEQSDATVPPPSFPILHSGPLDRLGSIKGGPYSDGCTAYKYERNHQYSVVAFDGDGDEPCLDIRSYRVFEELQKEEIFSKRLCGQIFRSASEENSTGGTCEEKLFSTTNLALIATASSMLVIVFLQACFLGNGVFGAVLASSFVVVWFGLSLIVGLYIPIAKGYAQFDTFPIALIGFLQIWCAVVYLMCWICSSKRAA